MNFCVSSISSLNFKCAALKMDKDRKSIIDRCAKGRAAQVATNLLECAQCELKFKEQV